MTRASADSTNRLSGRDEASMSAKARHVDGKSDGKWNRFQTPLYRGLLLFAGHDRGARNLRLPGPGGVPALT